ncbi:hypothetical protein NLJ89_g4757 [Agrocybe chaxingu]|uniref:DUF7605 domain-containing protein n=1 Tax=Agrocybe chaxingu TaxID=84603 RepID=A0A9W8K203_9AGAR|nr:hypothetical protein NLJ89_g4757 [Agrocybe chaxingu]
MSTKENNTSCDHTGFTVKPEPKETTIPAYSAHTSFCTAVKSEPNDAARVFLDRGLPVPSYAQNNSSSTRDPQPTSSGVAKLEDGTPQPTVVTDKPKFFTSYKNAQDISHTPEGALREGLGMVKTLKENLKKLELGSKLRQEVWDREIANLETQGSPKTLIAVCGACTAVVTEIAYHKKSTIDADISFLSEAEWRQELGVLIHDLVDEDGNIKRSTDIKSDAGIAWQKVHAVYPAIEQEILVKMSVQQILNYDPQILRTLGTTKNICAKDSKSFAKEIGRYIDSKDQKRGKKDKKDKDKPKEPSLMDKARNTAGMMMRNTAWTSNTSRAEVNDAALWPLIRQVNVRCKAEALSTGAVLVDLPGVADANAARNNIAKDYMKKCNCIWILAPITRAVDDKTARDLLGDAFKMQLMNGNYDDHAITFIASKCDDISCSEVIRALRLEDDPELENIEDRLSSLKSETSEWKKKKSDAEKEIKGLQEELEGIRAQCKDTNESDSDKDSDKDSDDEKDSDDQQENSEQEDVGMAEVTEEDLKEKIKQSREAIKAVRAVLNEVRNRKKEASDSISSLDKKLAKVQKEKNAFCSLKRSEFSRDVLKEDFRAGLKDLDDAAAEERDPQNFNPNVNLRDYGAIDLPVFTCSSRDYVRLKGQIKGDGEPSCFSNIHDTGIPDLQKWCHQLTIASRERAARAFLTHLKAFSQSIQTYVQGIGDVTAIDREALREKWESRAFDGTDDFAARDLGDPLGGILGGLGADLGAGLYTMNKPAPKVDARGQPAGITPRLCTEFAKMVDNCVHDLQQNFKDGLEDKCRAGATNAAEAAIPTVDEFASSMHWATYRATLRRHGSWRRDLNVELINPFTKNIAHSWSKVFESDLFGPFQAATIATINTIVKEVEDSAAAGLKDRAKLQGEACVEEARVTLTNAVELVKQTMNTEQKEVSRCLAPHIQSQLVEGYDRAMEERGTGSVARQKAYFRGFINQCKDDIFDDGADVVMERLTKAADAIGETLDEAMGKLAQKIEVSLAVLWEGARDNPAQLRARKEIIDIVQTIMEQIKYWMDADKMKQQAWRNLASTMDED